MASINIKNVTVEQKQLYCPPLTEIADVLKQRLASYFSTVSVEIVDCPDLTQEPFTLACPGLGGNTKLVEIGGPPFLLPTYKSEKVYNISDVVTAVDMKQAFIVGAGAGPWPYAGVNCEGIFNMHISEGKISNHTRIAKVDKIHGNCILEQLPDTETRCALLANLFFSKGQAGKVLKIHVKKRIGNDDFIASIRKSLTEHYTDKIVGLGGTFLMKEGKAKQHIMPDFSKTPLKSDEELNQWLKFYNMSAPLIAVGTLITSEAGLDLRVQHFHSFSHHGEGGHYHIDTTPDNVEYLGYFNIGESVFRLDKPIESHQYGRD